MSNTEVVELAESAASYAGNLYRGLEGIVTNLREDKTKEGLDTFSQALDGLGWLMDAISALNVHDSKSFDFDANDMNNFLKEMIEAAENMDFVLLADLIDYEVKPIVESWGLKLDDFLGK